MQEDGLLVHCLCVCEGGVLLGGLLEVMRSVECARGRPGSTLLVCM